MILDTNALSGWLDDDPKVRALLREAVVIALSPIVLGEYRFGILASRFRAEYEQQLRKIEHDLPPLLLDGATAVHYAELRRLLRRSGRPIPWHDLWIAAQARQHRMPVLSRDTHFDVVPGIIRIGW